MILDDTNEKMIATAILGSMFDPKLEETDLEIISKWDNDGQLTKPEFFRLLNALNLRLIMVDE